MAAFRKSSSDRRELLVWGYIRNIERVHQILNIPAEINDVIYLYQRFCDEWCQEYKPEDVMIDTNTSMITVNTRSPRTIYGAEVIMQGIFIWRVKIVKYNRFVLSSYPYVGIVENNDAELERHFEDTDFDEFGCLWAAGHQELYSDIATNYSSARYKEKWIQDGDILEIKLDMNKGAVSFKANDAADFAELFSIDKSSKGYRFALGVHGHNGAQFKFL